MKKKLVSKRIGKKVRYFRKKQNFSQDEIAICLGLCQEVVSRIESGSRSLSIIEAAKLVRLFKIRLDDLVF